MMRAESRRFNFEHHLADVCEPIRWSPIFGYFEWWRRRSQREGRADYWCHPPPAPPSRSHHLLPSRSRHCHSCSRWKLGAMAIWSSLRFSAAHRTVFRPITRIQYSFENAISHKNPYIRKHSESKLREEPDSECASTFDRLEEDLCAEFCGVASCCFGWQTSHITFLI